MVKYTFSFTSPSGEVTAFTCNAKTLNDGLVQFAIFVYENGYDLFHFSYYYFVEGKRKQSQRIFTPDLRERFWNLYNIIASMDKHYGIDK